MRGDTVRSGHEAETGGGDRAGLAGHGAGKALALESGGQVGFAAGEEAAEELHVYLHSVARTGRLRVMEWGRLVDDADIGLCSAKRNRKCEALDMKSDIGCDIFGKKAKN
jgi:hypothetical protein